MTCLDGVIPPIRTPQTTRRIHLIRRGGATVIPPAASGPLREESERRLTQNGFRKFHLNCVPRHYLSGNWGGPLTGIEGNTWSTQDSTWQIREYLSGYNSGPLTDIASFNYEIRDHVVGYSSGPLSDMRDRLSAIEGYLWSGYWGASAADLLGDIRDHVSSIRYQTDQLTFDGNGNLRVVTY